MGICFEKHIDNIKNQTYELKINVIWIDENIENQENKDYIKQLELNKSFIISKFKQVSEAINYLKETRFIETKIIITGRLYNEFITLFKKNILNMYIAPKIIVFTKNKTTFNEKEKDYENNDNIFYTYGGIAEDFESVIKFLKEEKKEIIKKEKNLKESYNFNEIQLTFEYIDSKEKLVLPLFFKALIDITEIDNIESYTNLLYNSYSEENSQVKILLGQIESMKNIPIKILAKYYGRLYTCNSSFYKDMNKDLGLNKKEKYLPYIKILYEGVKLKSLPLASNNILYRGSKISKKEIEKIKNYLNKKIEDLPSAIVFSRSFLSFSKEKNAAFQFLNTVNDDENISKILFVLEKDDNLGYNLATHGDIENISLYPEEREVLFFPFSSFEIKEIKEIKIGDENIYEINILYLGKYLKEIENDEELIIDENKIPKSEFKEQLTEFGLINKNKILNISTKELYDSFKKYESEIEKNIIICEFNIKKNQINKNIHIINSYDNVKRMKEDFGFSEIKIKDDIKYQNEKEIKDNITIKINGIKINFSYFYQFKTDGKYKIEYIFKKNISKINHIFFKCDNIEKIDLSNFDTQNVTDMSWMFGFCESLTEVDLTNFNTQNVKNMNGMFANCKSLINIDLNNFDIKKCY